MMGIKSKLLGYCAETLGGLEDGVSPLEMASAYATIANGGYRNRPRVIRKVTTREGRTELPKRWRVHRVKAFEDGVTYEAIKILQAEHDRRHRRPRPDRLPGGRQDRHDRQEHRRLVRRLHAASGDRGLGRLPRRRPGLDERHVRTDRRQHRRRHVPGRHLGRVHEAGRRQVLRRLQAAHRALPEPALLRPLLQDRPAGRGEEGARRRATRTSRRTRRTRRTKPGPDKEPGSRRRRNTAQRHRGRRPSTRTSTRRRRRATPTPRRPGARRVHRATASAA